MKETIIVDWHTKLKRINWKTELFSTGEKDFINIDPPVDQLVLHVRRDQTEYPFLEQIMQWAKNTNGYQFWNTSPNMFISSMNQESLENLNNVPSVFDELNKWNIKQILKELKSIGYNVETLESGIVWWQSHDIKILSLKEKDIKFFIPQHELSQWMFRALSLLIIIECLINNMWSNGQEYTVLIDDLCEWLDYERATLFTKLIFDKLEKKHIQLIVTSNDSFLMNAVDIIYWNILNRKKSIVTAYNYTNSKKMFDDFEFTWLNNFDFFTSDFISNHK